MTVRVGDVVQFEDGRTAVVVRAPRVAWAPALIGGQPSDAYERQRLGLATITELARKLETAAKGRGR